MSPRERAASNQRVAWRRFMLDLPLSDSLRVHLVICRGCEQDIGPCIDSPQPSGSDQRDPQ